MPGSSQKARPKTKPPISRAAIVRAVASSTAIETGQPIARLEKMLLDGTSKYRDLKLAR